MIDLTPDSWAKVEAWAKEELKKARVKNDSVALTPEETAAYRGEIRLLKRILDLPKKVTREVGAPPIDY